MLAVLALCLPLLSPARQAAAQIGFAVAEVPDPPGPALRIGLWYPTEAMAAPTRLGPYTQRVAPGAPPRGRDLPLVLISHGAGGSFAGHHGLGAALAEAGFVVAAPNHAGDTTGDTVRAGTLAGLRDRPRQLLRVLDWMLREWPEAARLDGGRVGAFGYSAGGFTVLAAAGGEPDLRRLAVHCALQPADPSCRLGRPKAAPVAAPGAAADAAPDAPWPRDDRIRAIVVAAPALGHAFAPRGLAGLRQAVQLWRPEADELLAHPWHAEMVRRLLPAPPELHEVPVAGHYAFLEPCPAGMAAAVPEICLDAPGFDRPGFHAAFNRAVAAFLAARLAPAGR